MTSTSLSVTDIVLSDTGPLYALADPSDQYHRRAAGELRRIIKEGRVVAIAYPTLAANGMNKTNQRRSPDVGGDMAASHGPKAPNGMAIALSKPWEGSYEQFT